MIESKIVTYLTTQNEKEHKIFVCKAFLERVSDMTNTFDQKLLLLGIKL